MWLEPWVSPCVFFDWWFSPWELWGYRLVHIVVPPMGLQTSSDPWVLSLASPLGTLCSVQWMAKSIHLCICQALAESLGRQLYNSPVSSCWHPQECLGLVVVYGMDRQVGQFMDGHSFSLYFMLCLCNSFHGYFDPHSKKERIIHTLIFLLLEFQVFCKLYLGY